jgi:hypothetical protein
MSERRSPADPTDMPRHRANAQDWPFDDPPNVAVITIRRVISGGLPITYVSHDEDDGAWQFLVLEPAPPQMSEAMLVGLASIVRLDPTILELADLPIGWCAWRRGQTEQWQRAERRALPE